MIDENYPKRPDPGYDPAGCQGATSIILAIFTLNKHNYLPVFAPSYERAVGVAIRSGGPGDSHLPLKFVILNNPFFAPRQQKPRRRRKKIA